MQTKRLNSNSFAGALAKVKAKLGPNFKGVISQSFLRAEEELIDGEGSYTYNYRAAKTGVSTEKLLKENDAFIVLGVRFALAVKDSLIPSAYVKQFYPNAVIFEDEAALATPGAFRTAHLEAIYNAGTLNYAKGDTTYLPALSLTDARFVPQTQQTTATNKSSTENGHNGIIALSRSIEMQGVDVGDWGMFIPSANNLKLQYNATATGHATTKVISILELHGILVSGGAKILTATSKQSSTAE